MSHWVIGTSNRTCRNTERITKRTPLFLFLTASYHIIEMWETPNYTKRGKTELNPLYISKYKTWQRPAILFGGFWCISTWTHYKKLKTHNSFTWGKLWSSGSSSRRRWNWGANSGKRKSTWRSPKLREKWPWTWAKEGNRIGRWAQMCGQEDNPWSAHFPLTDTTQSRERYIVWVGVWGCGCDFL